MLVLGVAYRRAIDYGLIRQAARLVVDTRHALCQGDRQTLEAVARSGPTPDQDTVLAEQLSNFALQIAKAQVPYRSYAASRSSESI